MNLTLYNKDSKNKMRVWTITTSDAGYDIVFGQLGGALQSKFTEVPAGKVNRTREEQIELEAKSKVNRQIDRGYKADKEAVEQQIGKGDNLLDLPRPMLAVPYKNVVINELTDYYHQPKLDGHRCMLCTTKLQAYTRNGKPIDAIEEILEEVSELFPPGWILDGELYVHNIPLQQINSWVKRRQVGTANLEYWIYDAVIPLIPYVSRKALLEEILPASTGRLVRCPVNPLLTTAPEVLRLYREAGFEGAILRHHRGTYEPGKRSKSLIKVKAFEDDEFKVYDITASSDGWGVLHCKAKNGKDFTVSAPGTIEEKTDALLNKYNFIGKEVTIEYANLTPDGVPFHPVAKLWRDKTSE